MKKSRAGLISAVVLAVLTVVIGASQAHRSGKHYTGRWRVRPYVICIDKDCKIVDMKGNDVSLLSDPVEGQDRGLSKRQVVWCNDSERVVVVIFGSNSLVGRESIRLNPGEKYYTTFRSPTSVGERRYAYKVVCLSEEDEEPDEEADGEVDGPTPIPEKKQKGG